MGRAAVAATTAVAPNSTRATRLRRLPCQTSAWLACAAAAVVTGVGGSAPARRLSTSSACKLALDAMLSDPAWKFMNTTATRWSRILVENKMATCCNIADFAKGKAEGCTGDCTADCQHQHFMKMCNSQFGKACTVTRKPFYKTGAGKLSVEESFCVPKDCDNTPDIEALMPWYDTLYKQRRGGWHYDYDGAELSCPNDYVMIIIWTLVGIVVAALMIPLGICLFKAPKDRGRTLVSQADMQQDEGESPVEPIGGDTSNPRGELWNTAQGGDTLGNSSFTIRTR